ncbi:MAG: GtrA family protein [Treponema sp.]|nr:GtrA family protein [Treponema sp.]
MPDKTLTVKERILHFLKYSSVSVIGTTLEYVLFFFMTKIMINFFNQALADGLSTAICYILAALFCYFMSKIFVFKTKTRSFTEALKFFAVATPKMLITTFLVPLVISLLNIKASLLKTVVNMIVQITLFFLGYVFQKLWVFNEKDDKKPADMSSRN